MALKILVSGDLHLGRTVRTSQPLQSGDFIIKTWHNLVDLAKQEKVDALLLSGDIVDRSNKFFEAVGPLMDGVAKLAKEKIPVVGVAGNHDYEVLSRIDNLCPNFTMLGHDGKWQSMNLTSLDGEKVVINGWSFQERHCQKNPLTTLPKRGDESCSISILHCDALGSNDLYTKVTQNDLLQTEQDGWILGHIHKPQILNKKPLIIYPGSPQALTHKETNCHGPWILEWEKEDGFQCRQEPLALVGFINLQLNWTKQQSITEFENEIIAAISTIQNNKPLATSAETMLINLSINSPFAMQTKRIKLLQELKENFHFYHQNSEWLINKYEYHCSIDIDLNRLSRELGPIGILAKQALLLQNQSPEIEYIQFLAMLVERYEMVEVQANPLSLGLTPPTEEIIRLETLEEIKKLIAELLDQKGVCNEA